MLTIRPWIYLRNRVAVKLISPSLYFRMTHLHTKFISVGSAGQRTERLISHGTDTDKDSSLSERSQKNNTTWPALWQGKHLVSVPKHAGWPQKGESALAKTLQPTYYAVLNHQHWWGQQTNVLPAGCPGDKRSTDAVSQENKFNNSSSTFQVILPTQT